MKIKPQWYYSNVKGVPALVSENWHQEFPIEQTALIEKLVQGVDPDDLSDEEFAQIEQLSNSGFLAHKVEADAPAWELSGLNYHNVKEQLKHITVKLVDLTPNSIGPELGAALIRSGVKVVDIEDSKAHITLVVANAYTDIRPPTTGIWLPVIANRVRLNVGPLQFPWSTSIVDAISQNPKYLRSVAYKLSHVFAELQLTVLTMMLVQLIVKPQLKYVGNIVEFDMSTQGVKLWPV
jgi:hypothetical protein